jgi:hypothetical protein
VKIDSNPSETTVPEFVDTTVKSTEPLSVDDDPDDLFISDYEYDLFYSYMTDQGYNNIISQETAQTIGEMVCRFAGSATTADDLVSRLMNLSDEYGIDPNTLGETAGALGAVMCDSDFSRLGIG